MMPIRLDQRLTQIAGLVDYGVVADVGCDHGKLGYYLIGTDRASGVIATDISAPSLAKASELAKENGVSDLMQTRLGNGLEVVDSGEVDTVIIAGLGGDVIANILDVAYRQNKTFSHFILSPNTHAERVRASILQCGHTIVYDEIMECAQKTYTIIKTQIGKSELDEKQICFGAFYRTNDSFVHFAKKDISALENILASNPQAVELKDKIAELQNAINEHK